MSIPHASPAQWPPVVKDRLASLIDSASPSDCSIALVGLPDELGVRLNGGRPGASAGPDAFRAALARFGAPYDVLDRRTLGVRIYDAGNIAPAPGNGPDALHATHERITEALHAIHGLGLLPVCIGGGHDLTFPTVRALAQTVGNAVGGINVDAHLDVRPEAGSGMPFRALIEGGHLDPAHFLVLGAGRFTNAQEHCEYLLQRGARIVSVESVVDGSFALGDAFDHAMPRHDAPRDTAFVSIDLDAIDGAQAPGVSAVNPMGLAVAHAAQVACAAGKHAAVRHFDLMELSPPNDGPAAPTARIAALLFLSFIRGFMDRPT